MRVFFNFGDGGAEEGDDQVEQQNDGKEQIDGLHRRQHEVRGELQMGTVNQGVMDFGEMFISWLFWGRGVVNALLSFRIRTTSCCQQQARAGK